MTGSHCRNLFRSLKTAIKKGLRQFCILSRSIGKFWLNCQMTLCGYGFILPCISERLWSNWERVEGWVISSAAPSKLLILSISSEFIAHTLLTGSTCKAWFRLFTSSVKNGFRSAHVSLQGNPSVEDQVFALSSFSEKTRLFIRNVCLILRKLRHIYLSMYMCNTVAVLNK